MLKNNIIDINQNFKQSKEKFNESNSNLQTKQNKEKEASTSNSNIKIKLNINSEVINNNFKISDKNGISSLNPTANLSKKNRK